MTENNVMPLSRPFTRPALIALLAMMCPLAAGAQPLFDAHLHYNDDQAAALTPEAVIDRMDATDTVAAIVTSRPPELVLDLHARAPERIVPFLGAYRSPADKTTWIEDSTLPSRMGAALAKGPWQGIGELHLFAPQRHNPVFRQVVSLARDHELALQLHTDPSTIDAVFDMAPTVTVLWAHAGAYPYPPLLRDYLQRYPNLYVDLSVRDDRIAPHGRLDPDWELLLLEYPRRFLVGVDSFSPQRWERFPEVNARIRDWVDQLPTDVASAVRCENAARLFARPLCSKAAH